MIELAEPIVKASEPGEPDPAGASDAGAARAPPPMALISPGEIAPKCAVEAALLSSEGMLNKPPPTEELPVEDAMARKRLTADNLLARLSNC